jgi:hypothetical protein
MPKNKKETPVGRAAGITPPPKIKGTLAYLLESLFRPHMALYFQGFLQI